MRATEIEIEEKEVERVYCDECGDECTENHEYEPKEVCPGCAEDRSTWKDIKSLINDIGTTDDAENSLSDLIGGILAFPIVLAVIILLLFDNDEDTDTDDAIKMFGFTVGSALWTSLVWAVLIL